MKYRRNYQFENAARLMDFGRAKEAMDIARNLLDEDDEESHISGHLCLGMIYEDGGDGVTKNLDKSMDSYLRVSAISPCSLSFINLARVSMKRHGGYPDARRFIDAALVYGTTPEATLCLASYHETKPNPDLQSAKEFYLKAAFLCRLSGFSGYSRVSRKMGFWAKALAMDALRLLLTPALILASKGQARFTF